MKNIAGDMFIAPPGTENFQPLGHLGEDGIDIEGAEAWEDWGRAVRVTEAPQHQTISVTVDYTSPHMINVLYGLPDGWLVFQGEHTGLWWSIPDDNRCEGAIFHGFADALEYAQTHGSEKAQEPITALMTTDGVVTWGSGVPHGQGEVDATLRINLDDAQRLLTKKHHLVDITLREETA